MPVAVVGSEEPGVGGRVSAAAGAVSTIAGLLAAANDPFCFMVKFFKARPEVKQLDYHL